MSPSQRPPESVAELGLNDTRSRFRHRPLPLWVRIVVLGVGWIVLLLGVAGLVLPGPGVATMVAGAAILSVSSELAYRWMRKALHRWPPVWTRVERFRERTHDWLHDRVHRRRQVTGKP